MAFQSQIYYQSQIIFKFIKNRVLIKYKFIYKSTNDCQILSIKQNIFYQDKMKNLFQSQTTQVQLKQQKIWRQLGIIFQKHSAQIVKNLDMNIAKNTKNHIQQNIHNLITNRFKILQKQVKQSLSVLLFNCSVLQLKCSNAKLHQQQLKNKYQVQINKKNYQISSMQAKITQLNFLIKSYERSLSNKQKSYFCQNENCKRNLNPTLINKFQIENVINIQLLVQIDHQNLTNHLSHVNDSQHSILAISRLFENRSTLNFKHSKPQVLKEKQLNWNYSNNLASKNVKCLKDSSFQMNRSQVTQKSLKKSSVRDNRVIYTHKKMSKPYENQNKVNVSQF